jgi:hypothetical protein
MSTWEDHRRRQTVTSRKGGATLGHSLARAVCSNDDGEQEARSGQSSSVSAARANGDAPHALNSRRSARFRSSFHRGSSAAQARCGGGGAKGVWSAGHGGGPSPPGRRGLAVPFVKAGADWMAADHLDHPDCDG